MAGYQNKWREASWICFVVKLEIKKWILVARDPFSVYTFTPIFEESLCTLLLKSSGLFSYFQFGQKFWRIWKNVSKRENIYMEIQKKVSDRLSDNPEDNSYIKIMSLPLARVWFRYRARAIAKIISNFKHSYNDWRCDFCSGNVEMT